MSFRRFRHRLTRSPAPGGAAWVVAESIDSTNSLARRVAAGYRAEGVAPPAAVFVAYHQSRGRGRGGHRWVSPAGRGVYASLLLPAVSPAHLGSLPLLVGVGLARGLEPLVGGAVRLRWPNDLLVGGRKLGGILIESMATPAAAATVVVGFGVNHAVAGPGVAGATSIQAEAAAAADSPPGGAGSELATVTRRLVTSVGEALDHLGDEAYAAARYTARSAHREGERLCCRTPAGTVEGRFRGFDRRGFLRLETADGERAMGAGELIVAGDWR